MAGVGAEAKHKHQEMTPKEQIVFLQYQVRQAHNFINYLYRESKDYGSSFSSAVNVDCIVFFRDNKPPKETTHVVVTKRYLKRLQDCALERLKLKAKLLHLSASAELKKQ